MASVLVVGSINRDYVLKVEGLPRVGETLLASGFSQHIGGKGANQAVAAARAGASVKFFGCVGNDSDGEHLLQLLDQEGIDIRNVTRVTDSHTGLAFVMVNTNGDNAIVVAPGANHHIDAFELGHSLRMEPPGAKVLVLQCEIPRDVIRTAIQNAPQGVRVLVNLAPFTSLPPAVVRSSDPLVMNQIEASSFIGEPIHDVTGALEAGRRLSGTAATSVVITMGAAGAVWCDADSCGHIPARNDVEVVDTTGAGDAFVGVLATRLAQGDTLKDATRWGVVAGSLAVSRLGAQSSLPTEAELLADAGSASGSACPTTSEPFSVVGGGAWSTGS